MRERERHDQSCRGGEIAAPVSTGPDPLSGPGVSRTRAGGRHLRAASHPRKGASWHCQAWALIPCWRSLAWSTHMQRFRLGQARRLHLRTAVAGPLLLAMLASLACAAAAPAASEQSTQEPARTSEPIAIVLGRERRDLPPP